MFPKWLIDLFPDELQAWRKQAEEESLRAQRKAALHKAGVPLSSERSTAQPPERPTIPLVATLQGLEVGDALICEPLTLVPLYQRLPSPLRYAILEDALDEGLRITEIHPQAVVSRVQVENPLDLPVLLLDGHQLQGGKQDRVLNASFLLPAHSRLELPVSCVERGRWHPTTETFAVGSSIFSAGARRQKHRSVTQSLRTTASFHSDQGAVWRDIQTYLQQSETRSATESLEDAIRQRSDTIEAIKESLPYPADSVGQIVFVGSSFLALDLLDQPSKAQRVYSKFLTSYIHEALDPLIPLPRVSGHLTASHGQAILESLWQIIAEVYPSVGLGQEIRFHEPPFRGSALLAQDTLLHLEVFQDTSTEPQTFG